MVYVCNECKDLFVLSNSRDSTVYNTKNPLLEDDLPLVCQKTLSWIKKPFHITTTFHLVHASEVFLTQPIISPEWCPRIKTKRLIKEILKELK